MQDLNESENIPNANPDKPADAPATEAQRTMSGIQPQIIHIQANAEKETKFRRAKSYFLTLARRAESNPEAAEVLSNMLGGPSR
jgi:hypothetical protein